MSSAAINTDSAPEANEATPQNSEAFILMLKRYSAQVRRDRRLSGVNVFVNHSTQPSALRQPVDFGRGNRRGSDSGTWSSSKSLLVKAGYDDGYEMSDLITKVVPLVQSMHLHDVVDFLAAISDVIELTDDAMVQKLMAVYEEGIGSVWVIDNTLRYAPAQAAQAENPPTIWQSLRRLRSDKDARRGPSMTISLMAELGRQSRANNGPMPKD